MRDRDRRDTPRPRERTHHSASEVGNAFACQKLITNWVRMKHSSSRAIPQLYAQLMDGFYGVRKDSIFVPYRGGHNTEVRIAGKPLDFLVSPFDVGEAMDGYMRDLDEVLGKELQAGSLESNLSETVRDAAWAYYTFGRIHPYIDGNGRMGRNILKRVMKGKGYKDIIFQSNAAYGTAREAHLDALEAVDKSGNLAHLEKYLLEQMRGSYEGQPVAAEIEKLLAGKQFEIDAQKQPQSINTIWQRFSNYLPTY